MRLGFFLPPFHHPPQSPTRVIARDLDLVEYLDEIGYDEVWVGEHHSGGWEVITSSEMFLAALARRTSRITLATGAVSLPYHHPFMVAERAVFLDHLSRGRAVLGVGPGSLPLDAGMLGIPMSDTRSRTEEAWEVVHHLLTSREPITRKTSWFTVEDATLQLAPYSTPTMEFAFTAVGSPFGPALAGRYGGGLCSIGATFPQGFEALAAHWQVVEEQAALAGRTASRSGWRVVAPMHIAPTREQARAEIRDGFAKWGRYGTEVVGRELPFLRPLPGEPVPTTVDERIDLLVNRRRYACVGTPEDGVEFVQRLVEQTGGFGCLLVASNDWAEPTAQRRSLDLILTEVAPHFSGALDPVLASEQRSIRDRAEGVRAQHEAVEAARKRYLDQQQPPS